MDGVGWSFRELYCWIIARRLVTSLYWFVSFASSFECRSVINFHVYFYSCWCLNLIDPNVQCSFSTFRFTWKSWHVLRLNCQKASIRNGATTGYHPIWPKAPISSQWRTERELAKGPVKPGLLMNPLHGFVNSVYLFFVIYVIYWLILVDYFYCFLIKYDRLDCNIPCQYLDI